MNTLVEAGIITEIKRGSNTSYILNDNKQFVLTEYKVLQNQKGSDFVKCMRTFYNGKIELFYLTAGYKSLSTLLSELDTSRFMTVIANLFSAIINVKNNGFLSCQKIDISFEHVYINTSNYTVNLVYLPINAKAYEDFSSFENELKTSLIKLINGLPSLNSPKTTKFAADLSDGTKNMEMLCSSIREGYTDSGGNSTKTLRIIGVDSPEKIEMLINKPDYIIGKNTSAVDGAITFNKAISRIHCKIMSRNGKYQVMDLGSTNGTFLNKKKLVPNVGYEINDRDIIRLAGSNFVVQIR